MFLFAVDVMYKCYEAKALGEVFFGTHFLRHPKYAGHSKRNDFFCLILVLFVIQLPFFPVLFQHRVVCVMNSETKLFCMSVHCG